MRVKERKDLTLNFWRNNIDALLSFQNKEVLKTAGTISNKQMEHIVAAIYEEFNQRRKHYEAQMEEKREEEDLRILEEEINKRRK